MKETRMRDDFVASVELSEEELVTLKPNKEESAGGRRPKEKEFCKFPFRVIADITRTAGGSRAVMGVLVALYEIWYRDNHYNPVKLTNRVLRKYGVSPDQKLRVLKSLEKSGQIWVDREPRKNPIVALKWLPLKSEFKR